MENGACTWVAETVVVGDGGGLACGAFVVRCYNKMSAFLIRAFFSLDCELEAFVDVDLEDVWEK